MKLGYLLDLCPLLFFLGWWSPSALAQVVPDATLGLEASQSQLQGSQIIIEGGANRGLALFHSFEQFNVADGQQVFFANPQGIDAILSRVTGTTPSNLDGTLGVLGPADLFLLNPNGILFGPNAQLALPGSFTASTADSLRIGDINFSAAIPQPVPLLAVNVSPGIQFGANAPERLIQNQADLVLAPQQKLSFDGGTIQQAGQIILPGGTVDLRGSILSLTGEINTRTADNQFGLLRLSSPTDLTIAAATPLTNQAISQALQNNEVVVESDRNLTLISPITSSSPAALTLSAGYYLRILDDGSGAASSLAGNLALLSDNNIRITQPLRISIPQDNPQLILQALGDITLQPDRTPPGAGAALIEFTGNGGILSIQANNLTALTLGRVITLAEGSGATGPDIAVDVQQNLILSGGAIGTRANVGQTAGNIRIRAGQSVELTAESSVNSFPVTEFTPGASTGNIDIQAGETILLDGSIIQSRSSGNAGNVDLSAQRIILDGTTRQALVTADTFLFSLGNAGNITFNAAESVELLGNQPELDSFSELQQLSIDELFARGLNNTTVQASAFGPGLSGTITVNAGRLFLRDGARLVNAAGLFETPGAAGTILINASDVELQTGAHIANGAVGSGNAGRLEVNSDRIHLDSGTAISVSSAFGTGSAGALLVRTDDLVVSGGSAIAANSEGGGSSGLLDIQAQSITVEGVSATGDFSSSLLTDTSTTSTGPGGPLNITAETLDVLDGGQIRAGTRGAENAGNLNIVADEVTVSGTSLNDVPSTIEAQSTGPGEAGNIQLTASRLTVRDRAAVSTQSLQGSGGDIDLEIDEILLLRQQGKISSTAGVTGTEGDGGNIDIDAGFVVGPAAENSDITANAFLGSGGNVTVSTNALLGIAFRDQITELSDITASSAVGLDGAVVIEQFVDEVEPDPIELPDSLVSDNEQLTAGCLLDEDASFVVTGRGGIPASSGEQLNQALIWTDPRETTTIEHGASINNTAPALSTPTEAQKWQVNEQGQVELVAITTQVLQPGLSCDRK